jgi:predicted O-methyltransferase YrrM
VGCGFGLFSAYFALTATGRRLEGVDPDARRVGIATRVVAQLGLRERVRHHVGTAASPPGDRDKLTMRLERNRADPSRARPSPTACV